MLTSISPIILSRVGSFVVLYKKKINSIIVFHAGTCIHVHEASVTNTYCTVTYIWMCFLYSFFVAFAKSSPSLNAMHICFRISTIRSSR